MFYTGISVHEDVYHIRYIDADYPALDEGSVCNIQHTAARYITSDSHPIGIVHFDPYQIPQDKVYQTDVDRCFMIKEANPILKR